MSWIVGRLLLVLVMCWRPSLSHYGEGWDAAHGGSQIWSVRGDLKGSMMTLDELHETTDVLHLSDSNIQILVKSQEINRTRILLQNSDLKYDVVVNDVAEQLKEQHRAELMHAATRTITESCTASSCPRPLIAEYMSFEQVEWFLQELSKTYPEQVKLINKGQSVEGRNLWLVTVAKAKTRAERLQRSQKAARQKAVFVEGGAHAREWISPATTLNILMNQVTACNSGVNCDFLYYFMPLINPDGYEFTRTTERFWRKNRSTPPFGSTCYGTDLNRNWKFKWGASGSSSSPCSQIYKGTAPFSAPEISAEKKSMDSVVINVNVELVLYLSYHSYGQLVLYPWGYSNAVVAPYTSELIKAAQVYSNALFAVHNVRYTVQNSADLYPAAGASDDHAKNLGVKFAYTIELRDKGNFGLPSSEIKPTVEENWAAFTALLDNIYSSPSVSSSLLSKCVK